MRLRVHLFASLAKYSPSGEEKFELEIGPEMTVADLLAKLRVPPDAEIRVLVNGRHADAVARLAGGDEVFIFPPAAGG